jgi:hypothetical protein
VVARIIDVAIIWGVHEAVVDGNGRDSLCRSWLHAGIERGDKQRGKKGKRIIGGVHRSTA